MNGQIHHNVGFTTVSRRSSRTHKCEESLAAVVVPNDGELGPSREDRTLCILYIYSTNAVAMRQGPHASKAGAQYHHLAASFTMSLVLRPRSLYSSWYISFICSFSASSSCFDLKPEKSHCFTPARKSASNHEASRPTDAYRPTHRPPSRTTYFAHNMGTAHALSSPSRTRCICSTP